MVSPSPLTLSVSVRLSITLSDETETGRHVSQLYVVRLTISNEPRVKLNVSVGF